MVDTNVTHKEGLAMARTVIVLSVLAALLLIVVSVAVAVALCRVTLRLLR